MNFVKPQMLLVVNLNVSKCFQEPLVTRAQFQLELSNRCKSCCPRRATEINPRSKDGGLMDMGHKMSMVLDKRKSNFGWLRFHVKFIMALNCKMRQILQMQLLFYYKMQQKFITMRWLFITK